MKVGTFLETLENNKEHLSEVSLKDLVLDEEGLKVLGEADTIPFDSQAENLFAQYLGISAPYLKKCPMELKIANVNHWLQSRGSSDATLHLLGNNLEGIHDTGYKFIPMRPTMARVASVFEPDDEVKYQRIDKGYLHLDVLSNKNSIEVPGLGTDHRPMEGDITHAGIRFNMYPSAILQAPRLQTYMHRLVCSNGMAVDEPEFGVTLRGNTIDEIMQELEVAASRLMENMPTRLEAYRNSAEVPIEGDLALFIHQYSAERGLPAKMASRVMDNLPLLGDNPTAYDVTQLYTGLANDESLRYSTMIKMQEAGGNLALNSAEVTHRCSHCERII